MKFDESVFCFRVTLLYSETGEVSVALRNALLFP